MQKVNIVKLVEENTDYRKVLFTGVDSQVVIMNVPPGQDVGDEVFSDVDQITVVIEGKGEYLINSETQILEEMDMVFVPAGATHSLTNIGDGDLKLYTIYAPPEHESNSVVETKEQEEEDDLYEDIGEEGDSFDDIDNY